VLTYADESFNTILELGFATSIRRSGSGGVLGESRRGTWRRSAGGWSEGRTRLRDHGAGAAPGDRDPDQASSAADVRHRGRSLREEHPAEQT
jgi:hypothetical protein